jgi:hypothetical protein
MQKLNWTKEEEFFLTENYHLKSLEELQQTLNKPIKGIYHKARRLKLKREYQGNKKQWSDEMIEKLKSEYPVRLTKEIAKDFGFGYRTVIRKARELNLVKAVDFIQINREKISELIAKNKPVNPNKGVKGFIIPNSEKYRFKKGELPKIDYEKARKSRLELIRLEKMRLKYGLKQKSKIKLVNFY